MDSVCQTCGDTGFQELLVHCSECGASPEHRYCLIKLPHRDEEVHRLCEQCNNESPKIVPTKKVLAGRDIDKQLSYSDGIREPMDHTQQIPIPAKTVSLQGLKMGPTTSLLHVAQTENGDCGHTSLEQKEGRKSKRCKLVLDDDDDEELAQKFQSDRDVQSAPIKGLTRGPTRSLLNVAQIEDKDCGHTSLEQKEGQKSKRCKLVLDDDDDGDELEQKFQSDCDVQSAPTKPTSLPNDSSASLPSEAPVLTLSDRRAPHEVMNGMQLACTKTSGCQQEETNDTQLIAAKPIIDCVWRGWFCIGNEEYGPLYGHLSNKACEKVFNVSKLLPPYLRMEKLPRVDAWPNSFKTAPPTDDSIGLYFFPGCARVATVLDQLLCEVINKDLVLKFVFDKVELLVFSATILPKDHQKFQGEYYLWGVFRAAQVPLLTCKSDCKPESNGVAKVNQTAEVSLAREKEVDGSNVFIGHQDPPLPLKSHCPSKSNEVSEEIKRAVVTLAEEKEDYIDCCDEVLSDVTQSSPSVHKASRVSQFKRSSKPTGEPLSCEKGREGKPLEKKFFPAREELEEGEICDVDYSICENLDDKKEDKEVRQYIDTSQTAEGKIQCLELFPLQVEDIGIVGKVGAVDELNLDLGLSCTARSRVPYDDRSDARSKKTLCRLL